VNETAQKPKFVYDRVAYPGYVVEFLSPNRLRASALMHGWRTADPATASVLEIGCGDGLNVMSFAAVSPGGKAVGFDLSAEAIERGQALVEVAGLKNIDLHVGDALTYPRDGEKFDYIICHGVLSWVPEPVRNAIVELIGARLAPGGLAYLGFDCLPGAAAKASMVPFLREWVGDIADPVEAMKMGARGIAMLNRAQRETSRLQAQLDVLIKDFPSFDPAYFFHDWLAEYYAPIDLHQFIPLAAANKLRIAGSAGGYDLVLDDLDDEAKGYLDSLGDDVGRKLVALDVLFGGHIFHRDLLIRTDSPPERTGNGLAELSFAFTGKREEIEVEQGTAIKYTAGEKAMVTTNTPTTIAVLDYLYNAGSAEIGYDELRKWTGVKDEDLQKILLTVCTLSLITPHSTPQPFVLNPGERPRAGLLARTMLTLGDRAVNLRGNEVLAEEVETQYMVALCDGTRTRPEIAAAMAEGLEKPIDVEDVTKTITHLARMRAFEA
jgi:SAM-dependent methyltransferase